MEEKIAKLEDKYAHFEILIKMKDQKHVSIFLIKILLQIPSLSYWFPNTKSPPVLMTEINHFHIGNISVQYLLSQDKG